MKKKWFRRFLDPGHSVSTGIPKPQLSQHAGPEGSWLRGWLTGCGSSCDCQAADSVALCSKKTTFGDLFPAGHSTWSLIQKPQLSQHAHTRGRPWAGLGSVCDTPCDCQLADIKCVVRFLSIKVPGTIILLELDTCNGHILQNPSSLSTTRLGAVERHLLGVSQALPLTHR